MYQSFKLHKRIKASQPAPPKVRALWKQTFKVIKEQPWLFGGIALIYLGLMAILVRGFGTDLDLVGAKEYLAEFYKGASGKAIMAFSLFGQLVSNSGSESATTNTNAYQSVISIIVALATVWAARQQNIKARIRVRDAFYKGMYPLIPFVMVLLVIGLQFIPAAAGVWLYSSIVTGGVATAAFEIILWTILVILLITLSLYMVTSSIFALFIVALPDMTPRRALRSARNLVLHRRWAVASRFVAMIFGMLLIAAIIMLPFLLWLPAIAESVFLLLSAFSVVVPTVYMYNLYYGLLK